MEEEPSYIREQRELVLAREVKPEDVTRGCTLDRNVRRGYYRKKNVKTLAQILDNDEEGKRQCFSIAGTAAKVVLWEGDITGLEVDCVVNAANEGLLGGGGLDEAIHGAAGPLLQRECASLRRLCLPGEAIITHAYQLPSFFVIHTVAPYLDEQERAQEGLLRKCYRSVLELSKSYPIRSLAIPALGTGFYGFPRDEAAVIALGETKRSNGGDGHESALRHVVFVVFHDQLQHYQNAAKQVFAEDKDGEKLV
ncbi:Macro domain-containing protein [Balamuthia mandrillaris]